MQLFMFTHKNQFHIQISSFIKYNINYTKEGQAEREKHGMVSNHSYVITGVEEVQYMDATAKLIRVRNPRGDTEWDGNRSNG